jgi:5-hydroxyisourate hydrolase
MSTLSTHVLDTVLGRPVPGVRVTLRRDGIVLGSDTTDQDGRIREFGMRLDPGTYRLSYSVAEYWKAAGRASFYPEIMINFTIDTATGHYHVPLLLAPFGYTTYRGS